jgi:Tol biopolymer transport system component
MYGNRPFVFVRMTAVLLAAAMLLPGCRGKEKPKEKMREVIAGPVAPPGVLVYMSRGKIWKVRKGEAAEALATKTAWFPAINRDGTMMAYWEDEGDSMSLHMMNLISRIDTRIGQWRTLGSGGRNLNLRNAPCWHPKKDAVLFADGTQIWQVNSDGTDLTTVYEHDQGGCYSVTVSPDGIRLGFVGVTETDQNLWIYSTMTKQAQPLTDYTARDGMVGSPAWSPVSQSNRIVFVLYKAEEANLLVLGTDGGAAQVLTREGRTNSPHWDPAGTRLVVSSGTQNPSSWQISLLNPEDGRFLEQLTAIPAGAFAPSLAGNW